MLAMGHALTPMLAAASMDGAIMTTVLVEMEMLAIGYALTPIFAATTIVEIVFIVISLLPPTFPPRVPQFPSGRQSLPSQA